MIEIKELGRAEKGAGCKVCKSKNDVKELRFASENGEDGGTCVFLCAECKLDLYEKIELDELEKISGYKRTCKQ